MSRLNTKQIEHAEAKGKEYQLSDGNCLYLRVRPTGVKSWVYYFRLPTSRGLVRMTLGSLQDMKLKDARGMLPQLRQWVGQGIDPRKAITAVKVENAASLTMQMLFDEWIEFMKVTGQVTAKWLHGHSKRWRLHLKKPLGNRWVKQVTRTELAGALDAMSRKGIKEETRKALTTLNLLLDYGLTRHAMDQNPARLLKPKDFGATSGQPRERILTVEELKELWHGLNQATNKGKEEQAEVRGSSGMTLITATAIKLLILTGARRSEVAGLRWDEVDRDVGLLSLKSARTKNRKGHTIWLGKLGRGLLTALYPLTGDSPFVFDTGYGTGIHPDSLSTAVSRFRKTHAEWSKKEPFTVHDLRRTAATAWGEHLKIEPHVIERMLNHQPLNKLVRTYQRAVYAGEQQTGWLGWDALVEREIGQR